MKQEVQGYLCMEEGVGSQAVEMAGGDIPWVKLRWEDGPRMWDLEGFIVCDMLINYKS